VRAPEPPAAPASSAGQVPQALRQALRQTPPLIPSPRIPEIPRMPGPVAQAQVRAEEAASPQTPHPPAPGSARRHPAARRPSPLNLQKHLPRFSSPAETPLPDVSAVPHQPALQTAHQPPDDVPEARSSPSPRRQHLLPPPSPPAFSALPRPPSSASAAAMPPSARDRTPPPPPPRPPQHDPSGSAGNSYARHQSSPPRWPTSPSLAPSLQDPRAESGAPCIPDTAPLPPHCHHQQAAASDSGDKAAQSPA